MRHALIKLSDNSINRIATNIDPTVQTKPGFKWVAVVDNAPPAFDAATEAVEGPVYVADANSVTETYTKRTLSAQEVDDRKDSKIFGIDSLMFQIAFNMENRVRALEAKAPITAAQYRTALRARV